MEVVTALVVVTGECFSTRVCGGDEYLVRMREGSRCDDGVGVVVGGGRGVGGAGGASMRPESRAHLRVAQHTGHDRRHQHRGQHDHQHV